MGGERKEKKKNFIGNGLFAWLGLGAHSLLTLRFHGLTNHIPNPESETPAVSKLIGTHDERKFLAPWEENRFPGPHRKEEAAIFPKGCSLITAQG